MLVAVAGLKELLGGLVAVAMEMLVLAQHQAQPIRAAGVEVAALHGQPLLRVPVVLVSS